MSKSDKDFDSLTDSQRARDAALVEHIRGVFIVPLIAELESAIPGYSDMDKADRFAELMKLNEVNAPNGAYLMLDFGRLNYERLVSAVYSGDSSSHVVYTQHKGGFKTYEPLFRESFGGVPGAIITDIEYLLEPPDGHDVGFRDAYEHFPLPFKIAVIAQYIRQNVVTTAQNACLFAAGCIDSLETSRFLLRAMEGTSFQRFGWSITLRDTMPENEMGIFLAQSMRRAAIAESKRFPGWPVGDGEALMPLYANDKGQTRTRHQSTQLLEDFFTRYLPQNGLYVGRSGKGERISMKRAHAIFNEKHPGLYKSPTSFANSYYNAKKNWKGR